MSRPTRTDIVSIFTVVSCLARDCSRQCNCGARACPRRQTLAYGERCRGCTWREPSLKISKSSCAFTGANGASSASAGCSSRSSWRSRSPACSAAGRSVTRVRAARRVVSSTSASCAMALPTELVVTPSGSAHGVQSHRDHCGLPRSGSRRAHHARAGRRAHQRRAAGVRVRGRGARRLRSRFTSTAAAVAAQRGSDASTPAHRSRSGSSRIPDRIQERPWNPSSARRSCTCSCCCCCA